MPLVAIILACGVDFKTYKHEAAIQSGWHNSTRFDASIASRLALMIDLDQGIQFVKVQARFNSFWSNSKQLNMVVGDHFNCQIPTILIVDWFQILIG